MLNVSTDDAETCRQPGPEPLHKMHDRTLTKMILLIVSTFMICWGPHACTSTAIMINGTTMLLEEVQLCCLALAYSTTILHPLIYTFIRRAFWRKSLQKLQGKISKRDLNKIHPTQSPAYIGPPRPSPSCSEQHHLNTQQATVHSNNLASIKDSDVKVLRCPGTEAPSWNLSPRTEVP